MRRFNLFRIRSEYVRNFAFAVPCLEALDAIADHCAASGSGGLLEVGAGSGFWASLLAHRGVDIVATDPLGDEYGFPCRWHPIKKSNASEAIAAHSDRDVLMSWPCYQADWSHQAALALASGRLLFYIGEGAYGCTATDEFHEMLEHSFELISRVTIPRWPMINDSMAIYRKL